MKLFSNEYNLKWFNSCNCYLLSIFDEYNLYRHWGYRFFEATLSLVSLTLVSRASRTHGQNVVQIWWTKPLLTWNSIIFSNSCDHIMAECQISITRFGHTVSTFYSNFVKITLTDRPLYRYMRLYRHKGISVKLISYKLTTQWLIFFQISWTDTLLTWRSIVYPSSFDLTKMIA